MIVDHDDPTDPTDSANHTDHEDPLSILKQYHMDRLNRQETCLTHFISRYCRNAIPLSSVEEVNAEWAQLTKVDISPNVPNTLGVIALQPLDNGVRIGAYAGYLIDPDQCLESPYAIDTAVQVRKHNALQLVGYPSATASIINCRKDTMYKKPNCEFIIRRGSISLSSKRKITVLDTNVIYIKTCAKIEKGEELLLSYGRDFWKTMVRSCVYCCKKINIDQDRFVIKCESINCQTILHRNCIRKLDLDYTQNSNGWHCLPCVMKEKIGLSSETSLIQGNLKKRKSYELSQSPPPPAAAQQSPTVLRAISVVIELEDVNEEAHDEKLPPPSHPFPPPSAEEFCELLIKFGNDYDAKYAHLQQLFKMVQTLNERKNKMELEIQSLNEQINDKKERDQTIQKEIQYDKQCLKKIKHSLQVRVLQICTTNFEILPRGSDIIRKLYRDNRNKNNLANNVERLIDSVGNMELKPIYNDGSTNHPRTRGMYSSPVHPNQIESIPSTINDAYAEAQPASINDMLEQLIKEELGPYQMNESSVFLDIGSGYGNCVIHAIVRFRISEGIGIEPIDTRVTNANLCLENYRLKYSYLKERLDRVRFIHGDATDVNNEMVNNAIKKATHIYCFDEVFTDDTRKRILRQLLRYTSLKIFMTRTDPLKMGGYLAELMQHPNRMKDCFTFSAVTNATPRETYKMYAYMICGQKAKGRKKTHTDEEGW